MNPPESILVKDHQPVLIFGYLTSLASVSSSIKWGLVYGQK